MQQLEPSFPSELERTVEQRIDECTFGRVKNLRVELINGQVVIHGCTRSYYVKLLALEAAKEVRASLGAIRLRDDIEVN